MPRPSSSRDRSGQKYHGRRVTRRDPMMLEEQGEPQGNQKAHREGSPAEATLFDVLVVPHMAQKSGRHRRLMLVGTAGSRNTYFKRRYVLTLRGEYGTIFLSRCDPSLLPEHLQNAPGSNESPAMDAKTNLLTWQTLRRASALHIDTIPGFRLSFFCPLTRLLLRRSKCYRNR